MMIINTIYCFSEASTGEQERKKRKKEKKPTQQHSETFSTGVTQPHTPSSHVHP